MILTACAACRGCSADTRHQSTSSSNHCADQTIQVLDLLLRHSHKHDVAVRRPTRSCAAVGTAENDVAARAAVHDVIAIQAEHHVIGRPSDQDVTAIERLVRDRASLNRRIVLSIIVEADQQLWSAAFFKESRLHGLGPTDHDADKRSQHAGRHRRHRES